MSAYQVDVPFAMGDQDENLTQSLREFIDGLSVTATVIDEHGSADTMGHPLVRFVGERDELEKVMERYGREVYDYMEHAVPVR